jgi:hypothetical protein
MKFLRDTNFQNVPARACLAAACAALFLLTATPVWAQTRRTLRGHVPPDITRLQVVGRLSSTTNLHLATVLPLRREEALTNLLQQIYDPASTHYHEYLTSGQFTEMFGPTEQDYQKVVGFAKAHGLTVDGTHPNRVVLDVSGPVANIEDAFQVTMRVYKHPKENRTFFAPDVEPSVDPDVPLQGISGLDNYVLPHPINLKTKPTSVSQKQDVNAYAATGSGPGNDFIGNDFRAAYAPGVTNNGTGQIIGLFEFGTYSSNSIYVYETNAHLSTSIVITNVSVNGASTTWSGSDDGEQCLDVEMAISMAPGATIMVYEGNNATDILNKMATDNLTKQISVSFGWSPMDASLENTYKQFAAQGQSCYIAAGDSGAEFGPIFPPGDDPYVTIVGGTSITTSGAGGPWQSETTWVGSSGGISTKYAIPSWQQGINMSTNHGSTTMRNVPDVAMQADTDIFFVHTNGLTGTVGGTSAAAPLWAGFTALVNQEAAKQGKSPVGFINPAVYAIGKGTYAAYTNSLHDITTGNSLNGSSPTNYYAFRGYDLCTGWGSPNGSNTINALLGIGTNDFTLYASQVGLSVVRGGVVTTTISVEPMNGFSGSVNLSISGLPGGAAASLSSSSTTSTSLLTLTTSNTATAGSFAVTITGTSGGLTHAITLNLTVVAPIPGTAQVSLSSVYNRAGIYTDGRTFSGGLDAVGYAYSANLLGPAPSWNGVVFTLGPTNALDAVTGTGQTITLPSGQFTTLQMLATAVNGNQNIQTFIVTYMDNSTATFTQRISDWANPQNYSGESTVVNMAYRNNGGGTKDTGTSVNVYGYSFTLDETKTVKSVTLPNNGKVVVLAITLVNDPVVVPLASAYNRTGMYTDGTTFTNNGGIDNGGAAYSATLLGNSQTWNGIMFNLGPANASNVIAGTGQTITLPAGNYSVLRMLATGVQGNQASQTFTVTYADSTTSTFIQSLSDWFTPQNYAGESRAVPMGHRNTSGGAKDNRTFYLYGYSFTLNNGKIVQSIRLPNNGNVIVLAITLIPNWQPTFTTGPFTEPGINAGQAYAGTIATNATDLNGDSLAFAKVSGPPWLAVAGNGALSGTPANANANTNTFVVSATDSGGLSNTATMYIYVNGAPAFTVNPFTPPGISAGQTYSGTIATNAADPNPGDTLTFAKVSGPAWLNVANNGSLSGTPLSADAVFNSFVVSVTDSGGLSGNAAMNITVAAAPPMTSTLSFDGVNLVLNWSGGIAPYQVQMSTNLAATNWINVGALVSGNTITITPSNDAAFYRIIGQ